MQSEVRFSGGPLRTPKAAAIAGIVFAILLIISFSTLRLLVPNDPQDPGLWLQTSSGSVSLALNLVPVAGICFLWFIGVLRDRLANAEDRFFATVFFGSGLLLLAMLFVSAALAGAMITAFASRPPAVLDTPAFYFARAVTHGVMNLYTIKAAGVFVFSTSMIINVTGIAPRWIAYLGFAVALLQFFASSYVGWVFVCFPLWVMLLSVYILVENFRRRPSSPA